MVVFARWFVCWWLSRSRSALERWGRGIYAPDDHAENSNLRMDRTGIKNSRDIKNCYVGKV